MLYNGQHRKYTALSQPNTSADTWCCPCVWNCSGVWPWTGDLRQFNPPALLRTFFLVYEESLLKQYAMISVIERTFLFHNSKEDPLIPSAEMCAMWISGRVGQEGENTERWKPGGMMPKPKCKRMLRYVAAMWLSKKTKQNTDQPL